MKLPLVTAPPDDKVKYVDALEDECIRDPNRAAWDRNKQRWLDLYTGNHFADPLVSTGVAAQFLEPEQLSHRGVSTICRMVYNRVMNAVLAMLAGQISNPPKVVFTARESGESPEYYLNGFVQNPQLQPIAMAAGAANDQVQQLASIYGPDHPEVAQAAAQVGQSVPLPPELADQVKMLIDQGKAMTAQARMAGLPAPLGIVPENALVEITDQATAQFTQAIYDGIWEQCGGIEATSENILNKKVMGWQATLVESDRSKIADGDSPITLTNWEGSLIFFDPLTSSYRKPRYVIMKEPISLEEGIAKYPDIADVIAEKSESGTLQARQRGTSGGGRLFNLEFARDMCVVRTLFIRDCPYPMTPDEALEKGRLQIGQVPDEQTIGQSTNGATGAGISGERQESGQAPSPSLQPNTDSITVGAVQDSAGAAAGDTENVSTDVSGQVPQQPSRPPTRSAFIHPDTGVEVTPTLPDGTQHPDWPIIYAIREIRDIQGVEVFDRRSKLKTFPVVNNINIPIPFSPYGFGEPDRLDGLQMAINRVLSDLVTIHRYNAYPPEVAHESVHAAMSPQLRKLRMQPNTLISVPREVSADVQGDLSKLTQFIELPPISEASWKLLEFLVDAIDKEGENTDVQQGSAPAGSSGAWVANLQAAASQVAQVTSQATEAWLKGVVRLIVDFICYEMTEQDAMKYCTKYPPAIVTAFKRRQVALYHNITVEIQSGSAAAKQAQTGAMIQAKIQGIPVSDPSVLEALGRDPDTELKQQSEWNQKMADSGLAQQMAEQAGAGTNNKTEANGQVNTAQRTAQP